MPEEKRRKRRRKLSGRHMLTLGALSLFGVSGYELWIRLEDFWAWTKGIRHLSAVQGTSFVRNMGIIFETPEMRELGYKLLFLCFTILFGLIPEAAPAGADTGRVRHEPHPSRHTKKAAHEAQTSQK